ncbi:MAG: sugar phosphate isomerase/epimerase family protein [Eubacteriales bacterium]|jgi:L-ribulose-5-phosphate 3-epimerase
MKLGVFISLNDRVLGKMRELKSCGFETCMLSAWDQSKYTPEYEELVRGAMADTGVQISAVWAGWQGGPGIWDFIHGPSTLGMVPPAYRQKRSEQFLKGAEFAHHIGVTDVITHVGFMPENPYDPDYIGTVSMLKYICGILKERGQYFLFETGQETPVVLLRAIEDIGTGNVGINLDTANLILYGKANPVDALDVFGKYVRNTHIKDGFYPTDGRKLGREAPIGEGKVDFPALIRRFREIGYDGPLTFEREISGPQQMADIMKAKAYMEALLNA